MEYKLQHPEVNKLIKVNLNLLLTKLKNDSPEFFVGVETKNQDSINRIDECVKFLKKSDLLETPFVVFENNLIGVIDGRHRIAATKKMGHHQIFIEVPLDQELLFKDLI